MSLDSLQKMSEADSRPSLAGKETQIMLQGNTGGRNVPAGSLMSGERSMVRSLDVLCDPGYMGNDRPERLTAGYRARTVENLPSATQSDNEWRTRHQGAFEDWTGAGNEYSSCDKYSSPSPSSPLIIEMAREIENLKSQLAAAQKTESQGLDEQGGGMTRSGNLMDKKGRMFSDRATSPMIPVKNDAGSFWPLSSLSPLFGKPFEGQELHDHENIIGVGTDGRRRWSEGTGFDQQLNVDSLPLVVQLRAEVARLQDQLKSATTVNSPKGVVLNLTNLSETNPASGNMSTESKTVTHLRRVIQVIIIVVIIIVVAVV